jgi:transcriptional regulator with XRE-family HTH domain
MQNNQVPIENRFGEEVLEVRRVGRMSQKDLSELLAQRGLMLDASAISRIEKGARAIRLSEAAVIAEVLGFSLSDVEHPRDPKDDFVRLRLSAEAALSAMHENSLQVADALLELTWLLERQPQLLKTLGNEFSAIPTNPTEYMEWARAEWLGKYWIATTIGTEFETSELREAVLTIIRDVASTGVGKVGDNFEHPEAT